MDIWGHVIQGFSVAITPAYLGFAFLGALIGTMVGVLPGLGPTSCIAILLPLTGVLSPTAAIIMMAGIYYGAMYGGSTTAILLNIPGEVASIPTLIDGYPLAKQGKAGPALGIAAIGSFVAGTVGVIGLSIFAPFFAEQALLFGPPEYCALMIVALTVIIGLSGASLIKGLTIGCLGFFLALIGLGPTTGVDRFTFGSMLLYGGLDLVSIGIGLFAVSEILVGIEEEISAVAPKILGSVFPSLRDLRLCSGAIGRGATLGFFMGLLPGCAPAVTSFLAYDLEKRFSRRRELFGKGAIEGVAAPESANNATSSAGFIPLLVLGIPASPPLAVLLGGLLIYGYEPGPLFFIQNQDFVWTIIASMYLGNVMLLVLNLPLVGFWAKLTRIPYAIIAPTVLMLCVVGAFTVRNNMFDVATCLIFGLAGYLLRKFGWPTVPLILCYIIGPMLEKSFVRSLAMSDGSPLIFLERPIALALLIAALVLFTFSMMLARRTARRVRQETKEEYPSDLIG